jgi:SAM-dependent methyltransferase
MANEAMEAAWDGEEGTDWAENADRYDAAGARVKAAYLPTIGAGRDDHVLDIGCGAGGLSLDLAEACPNGRVVGVDLSSQMLEVAAKRAAARGFTNTEFIRADAQTFAFPDAAFDLAVSAFGVMFFDDPVAAFTNIGRTLKPSGRVSFIAWRGLPEQSWIMGLRNAMAMGRELGFPPLEAPTPFSLSSPERNASLLGQAGFTDVESTPVDQPMVLGTDTDDAYDFFSNSGIARGLSEDLDEEQKRQAFANLRQFLADFETPDGVLVDSAAWIITARKP